VVPPGQAHRREATWADLYARISAGRFRGIILVSAYGFHTLGEISYKQHRLYTNSKEEFLNKYLNEKRADELTVLRQLAPHVIASSQKLWMLSVVTKEDLWWLQKADVEHHYQEGEYGGELKKMLNQRGQRHFRHELTLASLAITNFDTGRRERLKATTEGYDQVLQVATIRRLFETVDALRKWESDQ
jgi:hypothetical protein